MTIQENSLNSYFNDYLPSFINNCLEEDETLFDFLKQNGSDINRRLEGYINEDNGLAKSTKQNHQSAIRHLQKLLNSQPKQSSKTSIIQDIRENNPLDPHFLDQTDATIRDIIVEEYKKDFWSNSEICGDYVSAINHFLDKAGKPRTTNGSGRLSQNEKTQETYYRHVKYDFNVWYRDYKFKVKKVT